jgi:hypothetical protein
VSPVESSPVVDQRASSPEHRNHHDEHTSTIRAASPALRALSVP